MTNDFVSLAILRIRAAAGAQDLTRCPTCLCKRTAPARRLNRDAVIIEGCVDAAHSGYLIDTDDAVWHARPEAFAIRQQELDALLGLRGAA